MNSLKITNVIRTWLFLGILVVLGCSLRWTFPASFVVAFLAATGLIGAVPLADAIIKVHAWQLRRKQQRVRRRIDMP